MAGAPRAPAGRAYELPRGVARGVTAMVVGSGALLGIFFFARILKQALLLGQDLAHPLQVPRICCTEEGADRSNKQQTALSVLGEPLSPKNKSEPD
jgi:hypothetical protein